VSIAFNTETTLCEVEDRLWVMAPHLWTDNSHVICQVSLRIEFLFSDMQYPSPSFLYDQSVTGPKLSAVHPRTTNVKTN
jgi:hypothetical protein